MAIALGILVSSIIVHYALWLNCRSYYHRAKYEVDRAENMLNDVLRRETKIKKYLEDISNNQINSK